MERFKDGLRMALGDTQEGAGGAFGLAVTLFPVLQGPNAKLPVPRKREGDGPRGIKFPNGNISRGKARNFDEVPDQELFGGFHDSLRPFSRSGMSTIEDATTLGEAIRQQRRRLKVTQKDLAMASGSGLRFIVDLEKGKPTCQLGKALEIVRVLGMKLEIHGS
jgi:HTH-type transcriptional regulator / antitoxin HipB